MTQTMTKFRVGASFGGLNTVHDFPTRKAAEEWRAERKRCGCVVSCIETITVTVVA